MPRRLRLIVIATITACGSSSSPPWLAPDAIDDVHWGIICGPRFRAWSDPDGANGTGLARDHREWREAEPPHGMGVTCLVDRKQKDRALLELNAKVSWSTLPGAAFRDAEPIIDRITAAIANEVKPWHRPLVTMVANSRHSLAGRRLPGRFLAYGGYDWRWSSWSLVVTIREGDM